MMLYVRVFLLVFLALNTSAYADEKQNKPDSAPDAQSVLISNGVKLLGQRKAEAAIVEFDKAIAAYEAKFKAEKRKVYAARTPLETLLYSVKGASENQASIVISWVWALGYYYKGYALNELGRLPEAGAYLDLAIALSPQNAFFLMERGNVDLKQKNLEKAFDRFKIAADAAPATSPPKDKNSELARAWRGMGYALVEQGRLEEAESIYLKCIELDKDDKKAASELKYVRDLKAKAAKGDKK